MIVECLSEDRVIINESAEDYPRLLAAMAARSRLGNDGWDGKKTGELIIERDRLAPTALGKGVAIPRLSSDRIKASEIIICINEQGLPVAAIDHKPVKIVFLLLLARNRDHDAILAQTMRLLSDDSLRHELLQAGKSGDVIRILQRWEQE